MDASRNHSLQTVNLSCRLLDRVGEALQLFADALGLGFVIMLNGILKQGIQSLDFLNHIISLWHRHSLYSTISTPLMGPVPLSSYPIMTY